MAMARVESRPNGARPGIRGAKPKRLDMNGGLKISQLAREAGVTAKAIRFYEAKHVLPSAARGANGYRLYGREALDKLKFVKRATGLGLTLAEIREIISIRDGGAPPCPHVRLVLEEKARELDRKLRDLMDMRRELRRNLAAWSRTKLGRAAVCPHIEVHRPAGSR